MVKIKKKMRQKSDLGVPNSVFWRIFLAFFLTSILTISAFLATLGKWIALLATP